MSNRSASCLTLRAHGIALTAMTIIPATALTPRRVFITVAEVSGDRHAAALARSLKALDHAITIEGLGGAEMADAGVKVHHETVRRAAMGFAAIKRAGEMHRLLRWTRDYYRQHKPDLHVCVDSSGVNLHFARLAHSLGVPVLYYIAPQLWASRPGRIRKVRRYVDRIACILPFEEAYYRERGVAADFVGHPLFDELPEHRGGVVTARAAALGRDFTASDGPVVGLIAGSRRGEVRAHFHHMLEVAAAIVREFPGSRFLVPTTAAGDELLRQTLAVSSHAGVLQDRLEIARDAFDAMMPRCDFALVKSGTSTLHTAAWGVPMIVVYRVSPWVWHLAARHVLRIPKVALVNILAGNIDLVPEILPWMGSNQPVIDWVLDFLRSPAKRMAQRQAVLDVLQPLDRPGASGNAAKIALQMM